MIISSHQPNYLPYIGFFNKVIQSDIFVLLDHVQYVDKEWQNRNKIREPNNGWIWLTVPTQNKHTLQKINEVIIENSADWQRHHWNLIKNSYGKSPFFEHYRDFFEDVYLKKWVKLFDLNETIITYILRELDIKTKIVRSSDLNIEGKKTDMLIDMCKKANAKAYLSGVGGYNYLDEQKFERNNITLFYQDLHHPIYNQRFEPFIPNMSVIDLMFNLGSEESRKIILNSSMNSISS